MRRVDGAVLWRALVSPEALLALNGAQLADIMRLAWTQGVIFRLALEVERCALGVKLPAQAAGALADLAIEARYNARRLRWEVDRIASALYGAQYPILLLKGAAYQAADFEFAAGRIASDVDILVPHAHLKACEEALVSAGWAFVAKTAYDDHYYREWMHELPPMRHQTRRTIIDVHHTILPPVARITPDIEAFFSGGAEVSAAPLKRPSLADMAVHSALHCFYDGDFTTNIRALLDLYDLFKLGLQADSGFIDAVIARSARHEASRPVADALRTLNRLDAISLEADARRFVNDQARIWPVQAVFDWSVGQRTTAVLPFQPAGAWLARKTLYIRSHWITMPPAMLLKHLTTKAVMRLKGQA